jgi:hypothetical protein
MEKERGHAELRIAFPEYFVAVAPTSFTTAPDAAGTVEIDGVQY